jgi:hypothetical protein
MVFRVVLFHFKYKEQRGTSLSSKLQGIDWGQRLAHSVNFMGFEFLQNQHSSKLEQSN